MKVDVYYNGTNEEVEIPDSFNTEVVEPKEVTLTVSEDDLILGAIGKPIGAKPLKEFIEENESFLVIVNDHARPTPTPKILKHVMPLLKGKRFGFIVACGTHGPPSEDDLRNLILGEFYDELREGLTIHDSKTADFVNLGKTGRGTSINVNKIINEYQAFIPINSIEPHYFAGYTGGRKSFLPGISKYESIEENHSMALLEEAKIMSLQGNPLHEDFEEATRIILEGRPTYAINVVLDGKHNIVGAYGGDIFKQLYEGAKLAEEIYSPVAKTSPDVLISVVHSPLDQNLYQAQKGFESCLLAVKPGGMMILVASCYDGIGPEDYADMLQAGKSPEDLAAKFEEIKVNYQLGWHKVGSIPPFLIDRELWMVTKLEQDTLDKMFMSGFKTVQEAIDAAIEKKGPNINFLVVKDSGNVCPRIK
ncbi:MAG: nickel-dependent lactate racemase [Candidatus Thorarchaeota archaeon]|jgi:nickel-dependent lactate racemase